MTRTYHMYMHASLSPEYHTLSDATNTATSLPQWKRGETTTMSGALFITIYSNIEQSSTALS